MTDYKKKVIEWAERGFDREEAIAIFLSYNRNIFYMNNLRMQPYEVAIESLKTELFFKSRVTVNEMEAAYARACEANLPVDEPDVVSTEVSEPGEYAPGSYAIIERDKKSLREEFSFLNDADCPDEFEDIVQEMVTNYYRYKKKHKALFDIDPADLENCFTASSGVVESYLSNRKCWNELNYYKTNGKILGEHVLFKDRVRRNEFEAMSTFDLTYFLTTKVSRNRSYYNSCLKRYKNSDKRSGWRTKLNEIDKEELWVKQILMDKGELPENY